MNIDDMRQFTAVAEAMSFTAAAHSLSMRKQTLSRRVAELESALDVVLLHRTTRRLHLTDVGAAYADRCAEIVRLAARACMRCSISFSTRDPYPRTRSRRSVASYAMRAIRLATLLADHHVGATPETFALLALMHLHAARLGGRLDAAGGVLLLEEQDRSLWDHDRMLLGARWLAQASSGEVFSRVHAEAGIAAEHCFAPSFAQTRWSEIADLYSMLEHIAPSPLHTLNGAVAVAEWKGAEAGLAVVAGLVPPAWLVGSYLWDAVLGDLHRRAGNVGLARQYRERALGSAPTEAVRELLRRRLDLSR